MQSEKSLQPDEKAQWEPMRLTPVGSLGSVLQVQMGSGLDGGPAGFNKKTGL